jgi:hypothetical protein
MIKYEIEIEHEKIQKEKNVTYQYSFSGSKDIVFDSSKKAKIFFDKFKQTIIIGSHTFSKTLYSYIF